MTESEEMYLITMAKLAERGVEGPVPISMLAEELAVLPVSANQMVHKLAQEGTVDYLPYKGVALRPSGKQMANRTLRRRRLWELFLVEHLGMAFDEADALACRLEHLGNDVVSERLAAFLGNPTRSSQGLPIPPTDEETRLNDGAPLSDATAGRRYEVLRIDDQLVSEFLSGQSIQVGVTVNLLANSRCGDVLLETQWARLNIAGEAAKYILVRETSA
jgi:DtxR family Mn-dependent transcriptional regulator